MSPIERWKAGLLVALVALLAAPGLARAEQQLGLTLGRLKSQDRTTSAGTRLQLGSGTALQADYGYRVAGAGRLSILAGVHFLANAQRLVDSPDRTLTRDIATIYITPEVIVKYRAGRRFHPWGTVGGGVSIYEQSLGLLNGQPNPASRDITHGVFTFGGGVDVPVWRFIALRGEVRDFYSGSPSYNAIVSGGQHNVVTGGGFVIQWGGR